MSLHGEDRETIRHHWPDRAFHWTMAATVLVLLFSSFGPIAGIKFDWIPWHWIAGVCLTALLVFHVVRALFVQGLSSMLLNVSDLREIVGKTPNRAPNLAHYRDPASRKYDGYQKSYHLMIAVVVLGLVGTGLPMLIKLDTVLWNRNPGVMNDLQWGYIYVAHGLCSLALIFLTIVHVYFALLPEHKSLLLSMLTGSNPPRPVVEGEGAGSTASTTEAMEAKLR